MGYTLAIIGTSPFLPISPPLTPPHTGCGTMGIAILSGILAKNLDSSSTDKEDLPTRFVLTVGRESSLPSLRDSFPWDADITYLHGTSGNIEAIKEADIVLLACKPYMAQPILEAEGVKEALKGKVLASVLAGVTMAQLEGWVPGCEVVRTMTNTPSKIGHGMTLITSLPPTSPPTTRTRLLSIFSTCGLVRFLPEQKFNAATALAGSGPAFVAVMVDALADGGVLMGLTRAEAVEMAAQTMAGTARMILDTPLHPSLLKDGVTTPGGCTIAGLMRMEDGNVRSTLARTVQAATLHAAGLGQDKK